MMVAGGWLRALQAMASCHCEFSHTDFFDLNLDSDQSCLHR
jgi:hypothetical protein